MAPINKLPTLTTPQYQLAPSNDDKKNKTPDLLIIHTPNQNEAGKYKALNGSRNTMLIFPTFNNKTRLIGSINSIMTDSIHPYSDCASVMQSEGNINYLGFRGKGDNEQTSSLAFDIIANESDAKDMHHLPNHVIAGFDGENFDGIRFNAKQHEMAIETGAFYQDASVTVEPRFTHVNVDNDTELSQVKYDEDGVRSKDDNHCLVYEDFSKIPTDVVKDGNNLNLLYDTDNDGGIDLVISDFGREHNPDLVKLYAAKANLATNMELLN